MRNLSIMFLCCFSLFCFSCSKDDDNACIKDENYFVADFDGKILEPFWKSNFSGLGYTLTVHKDINNNLWNFSVLTEDEINITFWLVDIQGPGNHLIEHATYEDLAPPLFQKSYVQVLYSNTSLYLSKENPAGVIISSYDFDKGILIGTFDIDLYAPSEVEDIKKLQGEFNINLKTFNNRERPCWL